MKLLHLLSIALFSTQQALAATHLGCYSSLPSSFIENNTYNFQSSSWCTNACSEYSYFALFNADTCFCGNDAPDSADITDTCSVACFGFDQETCGGRSAYDVYSLANGAAVDTTSTTSRATTSSTNSNTATATTPTTTTDTAAQVTQTTVITSKNTSTTTLYSSETASTTNSGANSSTGSSNRNSVIGPAVGGAVGGVVLIALIIFIVFFIKRRQDKSRKEAELADSAYFSALKRDNTFNSSHPQRPISNPFISKDELMVDQRLNPVMINSRRRISEGSLADEADYSRKILRVANPDDELD